MIESEAVRAHPARRDAAALLRKVNTFFRQWPVVSVIILTVLVVAGIFAPLLAPYNPIKPQLTHRNAAPIWNPRWYEEHPKVTSRHILGADYVGRDVLSRLIHGARVSLLVLAISLSSGMIVGSVLGLVAGYLGRNVDEIIMRMVDMWMAVPFILVALVVVIVLGQSFAVLMGLLALLAWVPFVRNVRAEVLVLKTRDYVDLARVSGASTLRILAQHIFPGVFNTIMVIATFRVGQLIMVESILSFLGAGIPPPTPAWGAMCSDGRDYINDAWWISFFPGLAILLVVMAFNLFGDWLRDRLDPRLRQIQ